MRPLVAAVAPQGAAAQAEVESKTGKQFIAYGFKR
jgi:hypothetical protein